MNPNTNKAYTTVNCGSKPSVGDDKKTATTAATGSTYDQVTAKHLNQDLLVAPSPTDNHHLFVPRTQKHQFHKKHHSHHHHHAAADNLSLTRL